MNLRLLFFCSNRKISPNYAFRQWAVDAKQKETVGLGAHINRIRTLFIIRKSEYFASVEFYYLCFLFEQCRNQAAEALEVFVVGWKKASKNRNSDSLRFCNLSAQRKLILIKRCPQEIASCPRSLTAGILINLINWLTNQKVFRFIFECFWIVVSSRINFNSFQK